jgi:hypothetical protein
VASFIHSRQCDQVFEDTDGGITQSLYDVGFLFTEAVAPQVPLLQLMYVENSRFLIVSFAAAAGFFKSSSAAVLLSSLIIGFNDGIIDLVRGSADHAGSCS